MGNETLKHRHPWYVLLKIGYGDQSPSTLKWYGGTLISRKHIATAAHILMPLTQDIKGLALAGIYGRADMVQQKFPTSICTVRGEKIFTPISNQPNLNKFFENNI